METFILASAVLPLLTLIVLVLILIKLHDIKSPPPPPPPMPVDLKPVIEAIKNIRIPEQQKVEFPKIEIPKIEIPPAKEVVLDLKPVIEAINALNTPRQAEPATPLKEGNFNTDTLQEIVALMRVNQAEFQSGLDAFHKAIEKLLSQIPTGDKELDVQKEFMQKFEEALVKIHEKSAEAVNENSLRLQEILTEVLNKEAK
jgi:hypothetical protein